MAFISCQTEYPFRPDWLLSASDDSHKKLKWLKPSVDFRSHTRYVILSLCLSIVLHFSTVLVSITLSLSFTQYILSAFIVHVILQPIASELQESVSNSEEWRPT